jgi:hypothetical protein
VLVGEVTETEGATISRKRLYAAKGSYAIAEIVDSRLRVVQRGGASNFVVLGNEITKKVANECIRGMWEGGTIQDALRLVMLTMQIAASVTASVSRTFVLVHTDTAADIPGAIANDAQKEQKPD